MKKTQIYKRVSACALAVVLAGTAPAGVLAQAPRDVAFKVTQGGFVQENYTPASWQTYEGALNHAKGLLEAECDQETVNSAASSLLSAIEGLVPAAANGAFARVGMGDAPTGDVPAGFEDYTAVSTKEELAGLANQAGKYVLTSDIDLSGESWTPIANFSGTLDGNFHKITGLTGGDGCNGLFGESGGQFKNIIIDGAALRAKVDRTGALAGALTAGASVEGCAVVNSEIYGQHQIGGLAGTTDNVSYMKNSFVANTTVGKDGGGFYVGGLVGELWFTVMENCYFNGTLDGGGARSVGGITGDSMEADRTIANCYAAGKIVNVSERVGGIIGDYDQPKWYGAKISNCVALFESMPNVPSSGRIVSAIPAEIGDWAPSLSGNKALGSMGLSSVTDDAAGKDGATITFSEATDFSAYTGFSEDVWAMGEGSYNLPVLKCFPQGLQAGNAPLAKAPEEGYTAVRTAEDLKAMANQSGKFQLMNTIDLSGEQWVSIDGFTGEFDGNQQAGYKIVGLTGDCRGLFSSLSNATVRNLIIDGANINSTKDVSGILAGSLGSGGEAENCGVINSFIAAPHFIGGLFGDSDNGKIIRSCFVAGTTVSRNGGGNSIGGLVGQMRFTPMENCYFNGTIDANSGVNVGGITGDSVEAPGRYIKHCYAAGKIINAADNAGGIVGNFANPDWRGATVEGCVCVMESLPDVSHKGRICGLIPENDHSGRNITLAGNKAYGKMGIADLTEGADQKDGESISFAAATDLNVYLASGFSADVWAMGEGAYNLPVLKSIDFAFQEGATPLPAPAPVDKTYLRQLVEFAEGAMGAKLVTLTSDEGAQIYYTTDETQPSEQSAIYAWPLVIRKTTTVKAVAYLGGASSNVAAQTITVDLGENAYASFTRFTLDGIACASSIWNGGEEDEGFVRIFVPAGTDVQNAMPVFETSTFAQVSPQGRQDFTAPVTYTVDNGVNVKTYQVEVVAESDVEIEKSLLLQETFSGCTAGALPSGGSVYGAGTNAGGRYSTGGANTDTNHIITMAEGENKWVRATVGNNSAQWTLMATTSVLQEEVRQSQSLLLKFKIRIPSGKLQNGRMALLGLDELGNQMPTGDDDNDEHKEVLYFGETNFISAHKSTGESRSLTYRGAGDEPVWHDMEFRYVNEGGATHTYARTKKTGESFAGDEAGWQDLGRNAAFNYKTAAGLRVVFTCMNGGSEGVFELDDISLTALSKNTAPQMKNQNKPYVQETDTLELVFQKPVANSELANIKLFKGDEEIPSEKSILEDGKTVRVTPLITLEKDQNYRLAASGLTDIFKNAISASFAFYTAPEGYVSYDSLTPSAVSGAMWPETKQFFAVSTVLGGETGVLSTQDYTLTSSNPNVLLVTKQDGGYQIAAKAEGSAVLTVESRLYGTLSGLEKTVNVSFGHETGDLEALENAEIITNTLGKKAVTGKNAKIRYNGVDGNLGEKGQTLILSYVNLSGKAAKAVVSVGANTYEANLAASKNAGDVKTCILKNAALAAGKNNQVTVAVDAANVTLGGLSVVFGADLDRVNQVTGAYVKDLFEALMPALGLEEVYNKLLNSQKILVQEALVKDVAAGRRFTSAGELKTYLEKAIADAGKTVHNDKDNDKDNNGGNSVSSSNGSSSKNEGKQMGVPNVPTPTLAPPDAQKGFTDMGG